MKIWNFIAGWQRNNHRSKRDDNFPLSAVLLVACCHTTTVAAEQPSLELLEFLGSFDSGDGPWLDPVSLPEINDSPESVKTQATDNE